MKRIPRAYALATIAVLLAPVLIAEVLEIHTAQEEERAAWELQERTEDRRRIFPPLVPGEKRVRFTIQPQSTAGPLLTMKPDGEVVLGPGIVKSIQDTTYQTLDEYRMMEQRKQIMKMIDPNAEVRFSQNIIDEFMRLHDITHENDMVPQEGDVFISRRLKFLLREELEAADKQDWDEFVKSPPSDEAAKRMKGRNDFWQKYKKTMTDPKGTAQPNMRAHKSSLKIDPRTEFHCAKKDCNQESQHFCEDCSLGFCHDHGYDHNALGHRVLWIAGK